MTEDYKKNLIDYATGNITPGTPTTDEIIKEQIEVNRDKWEDYIPTRWKNFHFEGVLQEKNSDILILFGGYMETESTGINDKVDGIIVLLDNNFEPIKTFYEYDNGTKLRYIQSMEQAEDNSFYIVDDTNFAFLNDDTILSSTKRLVLLNNFTLKKDDDYSLNLRTSYIFPNGYNTFKCETIKKNPNQAQYVMVGRNYEDAANNYTSIRSITINIPYGSSVEWNTTNIVPYIYGINERQLGTYLTSFVKFQDSTYQIKMLCSYTHITYSGGHETSRIKEVRLYTKNYNTSTYSYTSVLTDDDDIANSTTYIENQAIFLNENLCYFVIGNINNSYITTYDLQIQFWEYNISTSTTHKIYEKKYGTGQPAQQEQIYLFSNQGYLYIENVVKKTDTTADYYIQRYNGTWDPILLSEDKPYSWSQRGFFVSNGFNLIKLFLFPVNPRSATWYFLVAKEVYNPTQYNGESYVSEDSLTPLYSNLYSNGSLIFSRNLYNVSKQNNMTMSSVEIPNNYLNDIAITQNDLISETNQTLTTDNKQWTKNIYEVVDLNFLNTISVIDEDTNTPYLESAIKLNNATTDGGSTNYQNTPCNKFRINYLDETTAISSLTWNSINRLNKSTNITLYVDKAITSIDLISNDETTIYLTIPLEVEIGKYYTIKQKVRIGDKPLPVQLQYNNEDILYQNEPVMVYIEEE